MSKIVFTQDTPGEREWLEEKLQCKSLQTRSANLWTEIDSSKDVIYEIPYSDEDIPELDGDTYKSAYSNGVSLYDRRWVNAEKLLTDIEFNDTASLNSDYFQISTFGRSGTQFLEVILRKRYKQLSHHFSIHEGRHEKTLDYFNNEKCSMFFVYRKDWWGWLTSTFIGSPLGMPHYNSSINWNDVAPTELTEEHFLTYEDYIKDTFDIWCNLRTLFPEHDFHLLEYSNIVTDYADRSDHKKIEYNKKDLITNYDEMKEYFEVNFLPRWRKYEHNAVGHLLAMGCKTKLTF